MLTTSRNTVTVDNANRAQNAKNILAYDENLTQELPAATNSYFAAPNNIATAKQSEYSFEEIARKILGDGIELPPEYDEVDLSKVNGAMPTSKTLTSRDENAVARSMFYTAQGEAVVKTQKLTSKQAKIAFSAFAVVVLALVIVIALAATSVSASFVSALSLEATSVQKALAVESLAEQLSVEDEGQILALAEILGYTLPNSSNTIEYKSPQLREPQSFNVESNWFDKLCDFLSTMFGG